jgi:hypothetical protein
LRYRYACARQLFEQQPIHHSVKRLQVWIAILFQRVMRMLLVNAIFIAIAPNKLGQDCASGKPAPPL